MATALTYVYSTLSVGVLCLMSLVGLPLVFCKRGSFVLTVILQGLIALGVGTLAGDSMLHLLLKAVGLHGAHGADEDEEHHEEEAGHEEEEDHAVHAADESNEALWVMVAVLSCLYVIFVFESIVRRKLGSVHCHDHSGEKHEVDEKKVKDVDNSDYAESESGSTEGLTRFGVPTEKLPVVIVITIGELLHSFIDGLIIGASYGISYTDGLINTVAVLGHELPHELGDFAILYDIGLSVPKVLVVNFAATLSSFVGVYIGIAVSSVDGAEKWVSAITAALFLYIAFIQMLPSLLNVKVEGSRWWIVFAAQNAGLLLGGVCMLLLAHFEPGHAEEAHEEH